MPWFYIHRGSRKCIINLQRKHAAYPNVDLSPLRIFEKRYGSEPVPHHCWNVPSQVDIRLVLVQPYFSHPQCIAPGVKSDVAVVRLLRSGDVSHPRAWQDLHTSSTHPNLGSTHTHNRVFVFVFLHCLCSSQLLKTSYQPVVVVSAVNKTWRYFGTLTLIPSSIFSPP